MKHLFCFGLGYSARAVAALLSQRGWAISGTAKSTDAVGQITRLGYGGFLFDGASAQQGIAAALGEATHLLVSVPPGEKGDTVLAHFAEAIPHAPRLGTMAYLSTVGVYGDWHGGWVDEESPTRAASSRSIRRLAAEGAWLKLGQDAGKDVMLFRLAGIYGPGRSAIDSVRSGTAHRIIKPSQVFNRIHVEDVAAVIAAAFDRHGHYQVYNVADDEPAPPQDVVEFAANLLGLPVPPAVAIEDAILSPMATSFYAENKRVRNARIKQDLGVKLKFPTYREGLTKLAIPLTDDQRLFSQRPFSRPSSEQ
jgi:nucleoside-diphosphate-sugar epimerase